LGTAQVLTPAAHFGALGVVAGTIVVCIAFSVFAKVTIIV